MAEDDEVVDMDDLKEGEEPISDSADTEDDIVDDEISPEEDPEDSIVSDE